LEVPELYPTFQKRYYLSKLRRNILKASKVVTVSETSKKSILNFFKIREEDILVVPNVLSDEFAFYIPSDFEIQTFKSRFKQDVPLILYTSGHDRRKNLERLISALAKLHSNGVDFAFLVTGESRSRLSELLNAMPAVKDKTYFLGYLTEQELKTAYLSSNVVVFPSLNEGFGRACLESMSTGTPLACSRIPIFQEIAQNYAFYFSPFDSDEMASVLQRAIKSDRKQSIQPAELSDSKDFKTLREYLFEGCGQL
jgi:glycosyltransferase involved in cell wall biosynthesis